MGKAHSVTPSHSTVYRQTQQLQKPCWLTENLVSEGKMKSYLDLY